MPGCNYAIAFSDADKPGGSSNFLRDFVLTVGGQASMDTTFILASPDRSLPGILAFRVYPQDPNTHLLALDVEVNGNAVGKFTLNYTTTAFRTIHTLIAKDILRDQENHILFSVSGWGSVSIDDPVLWYQLT